MVRKNVKETTGKGWFDMPAPSIAPELKKDIEILQDLGEAFSLCTFGQNVGYIVKRASRKMEVLPRCFIRMVRFNWDFSCNNLSGRSLFFFFDFLLQDFGGKCIWVIVQVWLCITCLRAKA
ncbi:hypothetical protein ACQ4PT_030942 [Festuca glaucescens]